MTNIIKDKEFAFEVNLNLNGGFFIKAWDEERAKKDAQSKLNQIMTVLNWVCNTSEFDVYGDSWKIEVFQEVR